MNNITDETLREAYKPYDIVTDEQGNVGFIQETKMNNGQIDPKYQISYSVSWLVGKGDRHAWYRHNELTKHCNLFVKIAQASTCSSSSGYDVETLMSKGI